MGVVGVVLLLVVGLVVEKRDRRGEPGFEEA